MSRRLPRPARISVTPRYTRPPPTSLIDGLSDADSMKDVKWWNCCFLGIRLLLERRHQPDTRVVKSTVSGLQVLHTPPAGGVGGVTWGAGGLAVVRTGDGRRTRCRNQAGA